MAAPAARLQTVASGAVALGALTPVLTAAWIVASVRQDGRYSTIERLTTFARPLLPSEVGLAAVVLVLLLPETRSFARRRALALGLVAVPLAVNVLIFAWDAVASTTRDSELDSAWSRAQGALLGTIPQFYLSVVVLWIIANLVRWPRR